MFSVINIDNCFPPQQNLNNCKICKGAAITEAESDVALYLSKDVTIHSMHASSSHVELFRILGEVKMTV